MALVDPTTARAVNPRVGIVLGLVSSLIVAIGLMALLLEALVVSQSLVAGLLFAGPLVLYVGLALAVATRNPHDYFAAGRRVPAVIAGSTLAVVAMGGTGMIALTGTLFLIGSDAFALLLGVPAGLVVAGVLFVPFMRKFGAYTVPGYLDARLDSAMVRIVATVVLALSAGLLVVAEFVLARDLIRHLTGLRPLPAVIIVGTVTFLAVAPGGMRALIWSSFPKLIVALLAVVLSAVVAASYLSNVPIPQLTAGSAARLILRTELFRDVPLLFASPWMVDLPASELESLGRRFLQMFGSIGGSAFGLVTLTVLAGVAGTSALLMRPTTTPSVTQSRSAIAWGVVILVFLILTLTSIAIYTRGMVSDQVLGQPANRLPPWFQSLVRDGIAAVSAKGETPVTLAAISVHRDRIATALPTALGLPWGMVAIGIAGALAACFAAASAHLHAVSASIAEDLVLGREAEALSSRRRLATARITLAVVTGVAAVASLEAFDPLMLTVWSLTISAATAFPVLVLSVLWKRLTAAGAITGLLVGLVAVLLPVMAPGSVIPVDAPLSAAVAMPLAFIAAVGVSFVTPAVGRPALNLLRDMRVPGGETLMDRQRRLLRLQRLE